MRIRKTMILVFISVFFVTILSIGSLWMIEEQGLPAPFFKPRAGIKLLPIHPIAQFNKAQSSLSLRKIGDQSYSLNLLLSSEISRQADIMQDISFIYSNGVLINKQSAWQSQTSSLQHSYLILGDGSKRYDVITLHLAEYHHQNKHTFSQFTVSTDKIYYLSSSISGSDLFRKPSTNTQKHWKRILDHSIQRQWQIQWNNLIQHFKINHDDYIMLPMYQLQYYNHKPISSFTPSMTKKFIATIWSSLYNYHIDHKKTQSLVGSSMPITLIHKKGHHIKLLFFNAKGKMVQITYEFEKNEAIVETNEAHIRVYGLMF